jgi:hypothetical protein
VANLNARISNGVFGISQANAESNWGSILAVARPQLPKVC